MNHSEIRRPTLLVVDDEVANLKLMGELLKRSYTIILAKDGEEALRRAEKLPDLILLDIMMPGMDGYEVCRRLKKNPVTCEIPVIFVTAMGQEEDEVKAFELGAVDFITKPIKPLVVRSRVRTHLELAIARRELRNQNLILEERVRARTMEVTESRKEIIIRLGSAAEYKDPETGAHIQRMSRYSEIIARAYGLDEDTCRLILMASPMHDIGKIGIPDNILLKPGKLDGEEWEVMKTHTNIGSRILARSKSDLVRTGQIIAISHHEKWDGTGYPLGLKGKATPLMGRICALADVFDALTSRRPYKDAWPVELAVDHIRKESGTHFEPRVVDLFTNVLPEFMKIRARFPDG